MSLRCNSCISAILLCLVAFSGRAQSDPFLDDFKVSRIGQHVFLSWQLGFGNTCNGITIHRSTDSLEFKRIGLIPGVCGSATEAVRYHFIDSEPVLNRRNYYQLEFGGVGVSDVAAIDFLDFTMQDYQIWPHPASGETNVYFQNDEGIPIDMILYAPDGRIFEQYTTTSDHVRFDVSGWAPGIYVFTLWRMGDLALRAGKFLIVH